MGNRKLNWLLSLTRGGKDSQAKSRNTSTQIHDGRRSVPEPVSTMLMNTTQTENDRRRSDAPSSSQAKSISSTRTSNRAPEPLDSILSHEHASATQPSSHPRPQALLSPSPRHSTGDESIPISPTHETDSVHSAATPSSSPATMKRLRHHNSSRSRRSARPPTTFSSRSVRTSSTLASQTPLCPTSSPISSPQLTSPNAFPPVITELSTFRPPPRISESDEPSRALPFNHAVSSEQPPLQSFVHPYNAHASIPQSLQNPVLASTSGSEPSTQRTFSRGPFRPPLHPNPPSSPSSSAPPSATPSSLLSLPTSTLPALQHVPANSRPGPPLRTSRLTRDAPSVDNESARTQNRDRQPAHTMSGIDRPANPLFNSPPPATYSASESGRSNDSSVCGDPDTDRSRSRYYRIFGGTNRFALFRRSAARSDGVLTDGTAAAASQMHEANHRHPSDDRVFGTGPQVEPNRPKERSGEEILLKFIRSALGTNAENYTIRLLNKTPITSTESFSYEVHQGTEDSDIDIIRRDLMSGRLFTSGLRLIGGAWCNLLLGDRFAPGGTARQRHELTYRRSMCSCLICMVKSVEIMRAAMTNQERSKGMMTDTSDCESNRASMDVMSTMTSVSRTPLHSAMANFVVLNHLPLRSSLLEIGGSASSKELEIGSVVRLNYRASAKLKFTDEARELFKHMAYTGPISHEEVFRRVTTIGVNYYQYNKGKRERKVYIQGDLIRLPLNVGVVKLGTQPMFLTELGALYCLYRKQIMSIYLGEIVLEGNSLGSFIQTGIRYYIGFGEERGVCPVFANKSLGNARKLGINELLLHHHMVNDLVVKCL